jgi:hypothetical protein
MKLIETVKPAHIARVSILCLTALAAMPLIAEAQLPSCSTASCFSIEGTVSDSNNSGVAALVTPPAGPQALITDDSIKQGNKELGPVNGANTKIGVIHSSAPPVLGLTSINSQTDLLRVYTQTAKHSGTNDIWYYFGWTRDSDTGAGFISIEFQKNDAPVACNYTQPTQTVIATCNPWRNRSLGDFLILWDQNGGSTQVFMRKFQQVGSVVSLPACPTGWPDNPAIADTLFCIRLTNNVDVFVSYGDGGNDLFRGEMSLNLTKTVFNPPGSGGAPTCASFANIIPNTITGNSDTADYKDTVLFDFPTISNCGKVVVRKLTDPAGMTGLVFKYKLSRTGANLFDAAPPAVCEDNAIDTSLDPDGPFRDRCWGRLTGHLNEDEINNVLPGSVNLEEYELPTTFGTAPTKIVCTTNSSTARWVFPVSAQQVGDQSFPATVDGGTLTCEITNTFIKGTPSATSEQRAKLYDLLTIKGILKNASDASAAWVRIELYSDSGCTAKVAETGPITLNGKYVSEGTTTNKVDLSTLVDQVSNETGIVVAATGGVTRYWAFRYSGDALNNPIDSNLANAPTSTCGLERATVTFVNGAFPPPTP